MSSLVHSLMIAVMLLHSILGCCWHHSHEEVGCGCVTIAHSDESSGHSHGTCSYSSDYDCDHDHSDAGPGEESRDVPHPNAPCDHDECVYMTGQGLSAPASLDVAFVPSLDCPCATGLVADIHRRVETAEASPRRASSLDSCALLQVWRV